MNDIEFAARLAARTEAGGPLDVAVARAELEHGALKEELRDIFSQARCLRCEQAPRVSNADLERLNVCVRHFMEQWDAHMKWEEEELYPRSVRYLDAEADLFAYSGMTDALAERLVKAFGAAAEQAPAKPSKDDVCRITSYLLQAYPILKNRLDEEEEVMATLTDRSNRFDF